MAMRRPLAPLGGKRLNTLNSSSQQLDLKNIKQSVVPAEKKSFSTNRFGGGSCLIPVDGAEDIDQYLRHIEIKYNVPKEFLRGHPGGVDGRMRQILVDWLFHVQKRFNFFTETLSLAVNVLDRALLVMPNINKDNLQLLGVTCLFCASKFEEILVPHIDDFVHVAADVFTKHDIFQMEQRVLSALNFDFGSTHSIHFLRRYRFYVSPSVEVYQLSKYICEVALISYQLAHYLPSTVAAVGIWLASYTHGRQLTSAQLFSNVFKMDQKELISIARIFVDYVLQYADSSERLYALRQKHHVSALELLTNAHVLRLHEFSDFGL